MVTFAKKITKGLRSIIAVQADPTALRFDVIDQKAKLAFRKYP
jgi:hypothetical protein